MTIRDVIHTDIVIEDKLYIDLIMTSEFQRMRKIRQLGLTYKVFACAEHTRFSHSIGVYYLATVALGNLEKRNSDFATQLEKTAFLVSCLLHDVGHGPLSHAAEIFFNYHHEALSCKIIKNQGGEIYKILEDFDPKITEQVCGFIEKTHPNEVLNSLLSGSCDLDRMDYLLRDSHHCGVVYGNFEPNIILSEIDIVQGRLVFGNKALKPIEDFILCRYQMFCQVYLNVTSLAYELMIVKILDRVNILIKQKYQFKTNIVKLVKFFEDDISIGDYLKMNDFVFLAILEDFKEENDDLLRDLAISFDRNYDAIGRNEREEDQKYFKIDVKEYVKSSFYKETVLVKSRRGSVKALDKMSPLVEFAKNSLTYKVEKQVLYVKR